MTLLGASVVLGGAVRSSNRMPDIEEFAVSTILQDCRLLASCRRLPFGAALGRAVVYPKKAISVIADASSLHSSVRA